MINSKVALKSVLLDKDMLYRVAKIFAEEIEGRKIFKKD